MGAVGYTSAVSERDYYLAEQARESAEIDATPDAERQEIREIYAAKGFTGNLLDRVVDTITANREAWLATMMDEELHLQPVQTPDILRSAVVITIATLIGHLIPLLPFAWLSRTAALITAFALSALVLFGVGVYSVGDPGRRLAQERAENGRDRTWRRRRRLPHRPPVPRHRGVKPAHSHPTRNPLRSGQRPASAAGQRSSAGTSARRWPAGWSASSMMVTLPVRTCSRQRPDNRRQRMGTVMTSDGTEIFYKDWGSGQPIVFSHGWPLSGDDWDTQMLFFLQHGYRVIAHDRRGHGRSTQTSDGHDMDHYADDLAAVTAHLDLQDAIHVGHSTGGGEVVHYIARHGESRVAKAVLISSVPPLMVQTDANPGGLPKSVFDDLQAQLAANRSEFYRALPSGPFYGFNRPGAESSEAIIENWWRQGMMGGAKAHYDGIVAFSQTDFTEDLKKITVPVLVMHGDDDQIVPYADSGPLSARARAERDAEDVQRIPARHADHRGRDDQR